MPHSLSRRQFVTLAGSALGAGLVGSASLAVEAFQRAGKPRFALSLAAYSFRQYFKDTNNSREKRPPAEKQIDLFQFIDYCADHGCHGAELTSYYFPAQLTNDFLLKVKHHAFLRGVELSGTAVGNTFTVPDGEKRDKEIAGVKKWIDHAALI
jgi:hypothetical protein